MKDRSTVAATCLEVAGYIQFPLGLFVSLAIFASNGRWSGFMAALTLLLSLSSAGLALLSGRWLRNVQFRGWITGVILSSLYLVSLFLPLAVVTLWALLSKGTRHRYLRADEA